MTDEQIIKALNKADGLEHVGIHCGNKKGEYIGLVKVCDIVDLINRQKAEIERLQNDLSTWKDIAHRETSYVSIAKADAIKEFAERLKAHRTLGAGAILWYEIHKVIDNLVKEMVGEG